jgi:SAM-dependent methyltransferase
MVYGENHKINRSDYTNKLTEEIVSKYINISNENISNIDLINKNIKLKLLDIGCGVGLQALAFSDNFLISGLDISDDAKELFASEGKEIDLRRANLDKDIYPFESNSFDVIFSKSVIEHLHNTNHFLQEIFRLLKPSGKLILMCPAWETQYKNFYDDYTHVKPFTAIGLDAALNINGFKKVEVKQFYQLPLIWKYPFLAYISKIIALLPDRLKWKKGQRIIPNKLVRFSKETMLLAVCCR